MVEWESDVASAMFHGGGSPRYATTTPQCASILPPRPQTGQHGHFVCESPVCVCVSAPLHMLVRTIFPCTGHHDTIRAVTGFGRIGRVGRELVVGDSGGCKPENASVYLGNKTAGKIERATGPCHTSDDDQGLGGAQGKERERERGRGELLAALPHSCGPWQWMWLALQRLLLGVDDAASAACLEQGVKGWKKTLCSVSTCSRLPDGTNFAYSRAYSALDRSRAWQR